MKVRLVALISVMLMSAVACGSEASPAPLPSLVGLPSTSQSASVAPSLVIPAPTTSVLVPTIAPTITTTAPTPPVPAPDPHGVAIETGCIRSNIDFAAVREAPGVEQPEVGRIPPATCNVLVYATGTDGRIAWLEVGVGDIFGWSAQSNFVQATLVPAPTAAPP